MKKPIRTVFIICICAAMLCIPLTAFRKARKAESPEALPEASPEALEAGAEFERQLSPSADVVWLTHCLRCGHTYSYTDSSPVIGLTRDELASRYPEWSIPSFTREFARLERSFDGYCPDHFILCCKGKRLSVYTVSEPELELEELISFDCSPYSFTVDELKALAEGVAFDSLIELDRYTDRHKGQ